MNSSQVYVLVEDVAAASGKSKLPILEKALMDPLFQKIMVYAYNPFITYGIKKLPDIISRGDDEIDADTFGLLNRLASRELAGNAAREAVENELTRLNLKSAILLRRVLLKDMRAGFTENTLNKLCKGLIPVFPYSRCGLPKNTKLDEWDWANGIFSQEKADGMFVNVNLDETTCWLTSRQGTPLPPEGFTGLVAEIEARLGRNTQTHGELLVVGPNGQVLVREEGNGVLNSVIQGGPWPEGHRPILKVWDQIPLSNVVPKGRCKTPYDRRLAGLYKSLKDNPGELISLIETRVVRSLKEAYAHYKELLLQGKEGTVIKRRQMIWYDTGSGYNPDQIKLKLKVPVELEIIDFLPGDPTGKHASTFGSLLCRTSCDKLRVGVSGIKDTLRLEIHNNREEWRHRIVTVSSNAIMYSDDLVKKPHSLFLPAFEEWRQDKSEADSFDRVIEQFDNAMANV